MDHIIASGNHTYIWGVTGQNPTLLKHTISQVPSARVIKAVMHNQYRPDNLERLYGTQHYTYGCKVQLLLRAVGRLGRRQGVLSTQKGSFRPQNRFPPFCVRYGSLNILEGKLLYIRHSL